MCCHCRCSSPLSNANTCCEHLPLSNADARNYDERGCDAAEDWRNVISSTSDADKVVQGGCDAFAMSSVMIAPHLCQPPAAFHCRLQPLLIVEYIFTNFSTFILPSPKAAWHHI
jgi:hypothetical protein